MNRPTARLASALAGAAATAVVLAGTSGATHLGSLQLGHANTTTAQTSLTANLGTPVFKVVNQGGAAAVRGEAQNGIGINGVSIAGVAQQGLSQTGIGSLGTHGATTGVNPGVQGETNSTDPGGAGVVGKNMGGGPGLRAIVNAGAPPLAVNSSIKVSNLNVDLLDGLDSAALQNRVSGTCGAGSAIKVVNANGTVTCEPVGIAGAWGLAGNSGTTPGTNFLGTTDNTALELKVNGQRALRIEPAIDPGGGDIFAPTLIGGGPTNDVSPGAYGGTISGGGRAGVSNRVTDAWGTIGGGFSNTAGDGTGTQTDAHSATVAGGSNNTASGAHSAVGGGAVNMASGEWATIAGGNSNEAVKFAATVGGGVMNTAGFEAAVGGGNQNGATGHGSTIGGGASNFAPGAQSAIGGGGENAALADNSTVSGGSSNEVTATGNYAAIAGGLENEASGYAAIVAGGYQNTAGGLYSFAAGNHARATHHGSFVWADSIDLDFRSIVDNGFYARATGGFKLVTGVDGTTGDATSFCLLAAGSGTWDCVSDRNAKEHFAPVDSERTLKKLARIPIESWNYRSQDDSIRHIGPMAQDFRAAFGLGIGNKTIAGVDADGIAFSAIQGLYRQNQTLERQNRALATRLARLERVVAGLSR